MEKIRSSEITPEHVYHSRRRFMARIGAAGAGALLAACKSESSSTSAELSGELTPYESVTTYNNFYEFSLFLLQ